MAATILHLRGSREAPKAVRSSMETVILSEAELRSWVLPPFQRQLTVNDKVKTVSELIRRTEVIPGLLTLGRLPADRTTYFVDGQHRRAGFFMSGLAECIADVRIMHFDTIMEMANEFVRLNSHIKNLRPDDILRGLESNVQSLDIIRKRCEFVGYDNLRRNSKTPMLSMSTVLRTWCASASDTPTSNAKGRSAVQMAEEIDQVNATCLVQFLLLARAAWGADPEYFRLWGTLNLTICMWLWRRLVVDTERGVKRALVLSPEQFKRCLMSVSATPDYLDWLTGRVMGDRDRSPCYARLRAIFHTRLRADLGDGQKVLLPGPAWASK